MASFQLSPGVSFTERDLTNIVPAVATTPAGFAGSFVWGPVNERVLIDSRENLRLAFGNAADDNAYTTTGINAPATDFLTAFSFLEYGNNLTVVRVVGATAVNANAAGSTTGVRIDNEDDWEDTSFTSAYGNFVAKYPGALGNSLRVSICDNLGTTSAPVYKITGSSFTTGSLADVPAANPQTSLGSSAGIGTDGTTVTADTTFKLLSAEAFGNDFVFYIQQVGADLGTTIDGLTTDGYIHFSDGAVAQIKRVNSVFQIVESAAGDLNQGSAYNVWQYRDSFNGSPGTSDYSSTVNGSEDEFHLVVVDEDGLWTGQPGTILERFNFLSKSSDAKYADGTSAYWVDVLRENSQYLWPAERAFATDNGSQTFNINAGSKNWGSFGIKEYSLSGGNNGAMPTAGDYVAAYNTYFADAQAVDVSLLISPGANAQADAKTLADALITIASVRRDCVAFLSPALNDVRGSTPRVDIIEYRNSLTSTSYACLDSGWKLRFDAFNDKNRWVPLCADAAGLCVRTDQQADPWFSNAGFNRGQILSSVKLAYNPNQADRDRLYPNGINPVVTFPGQGTVLYGDKTLLSRPSAFDRINVRRLFIVMEKAIATASKFFLFEQNDEFTRNQFVNLVTPFLRDIQGRRGITDFRVIADSTVNTPSVVDANEFRAQIYVKPTRVVNAISLDFVATPTGVSFQEVTG